MVSSPTLSIITVTYNCAEALEPTLSSVLSQRMPGLEYIVIDGGSTDGTQVVIESVSDRLAYWCSEQDDGIADAFNKGIARATGSLIGLLNAGDQYTPGSLQAVAEAHRNHPDHVLHGDAMWYEGPKQTHLKPRRWPRWSVYLDMPFLHPTCFVPRQVYDRVGVFEEHYRYAMDYEWALRALRSGVVFDYLPRVLTRYQAGGAAITHAGEAYREVCHAQRAHGINPVWAYGSYALKRSLVTAIPLPMLKRGVNRVLRVVRRGEA